MDFTKLYFIRHGQVVGHEQLRFNGHTDVDLTPLGAAQLEAVAEDLADVEFSAVYSSDLKRARYGGEALTRSRNIELRADPAFRELYFGEWEGMNFDEVEARYPGALEDRRNNVAHHRAPGAETIQEFWDRVKTRLDQVVAEHWGGNIALVAHSGVNRVVLLQAIGCGPELVWHVHQDYGCLNIVEFYPDNYTIVKLANGPNRVQGDGQKF